MSISTTPNFRFPILRAVLVVVVLPWIIALASGPLDGLDSAAAQVALFVCSLWFIWRRKLSSADITGPLPDWRTCARWLAIGLALAVSSYVAITLVGVQGYIPNPSHPSAAEAVPLEMTIIGGLIAPLTEELAFRGLLLRNCLQRTATGRAALLTALLFALLHLDTLIAPQLFGGLLMGLVMLRTRSLWLCVAVHAQHNILMDLFDKADDLTAVNGQPLLERACAQAPQWLAWALVAAFLAGWATVFWRLHRAKLAAEVEVPPSMPALATLPACA